MFALRSELRDSCWQTDSQHLAVALADGTVDLWNAQTGQLDSELLKLENAVESIVFSPDGQFMVVGNSAEIQIYRLTNDTGTKTQVATLTNEPGLPEGDFGYLFAMNSAFVIVTSENVSIWNFESGRMEGVIPTGEGLNQRIIPSADGKMIATVGQDHLVKVWDGHTGELRSQIKGHRNIVYGVGFDPQGRVVSGGRDQTVRVSPAEKFTSALTLRGHTDWIWSVAFSPSGKVLASSSDDRNIILWDVASGAEVARLRAHSESVQFVRFSPTENLLASASRDQTIKFWNTETHTLQGECLGHRGAVNSLDFSSDGTQLVSGGSEGSVIVWDVKTREILSRYDADTKCEIWSVAFGPDGSVVFGGTNHLVQTWKFADGELPRVLHEFDSNITSLNFSPDNVLLSCTTSNGSVTIFDFKLRVFRSQPTAHTSDAIFADFSPDGRTLVSCGTDGKLRFVYVEIDEPTIEINAHDAHVHSVTFAPDGKTIASGSWDHTIKIWSVE